MLCTVCDVTGALIIEQSATIPHHALCNVLALFNKKKIFKKPSNKYLSHITQMKDFHQISSFQMSHRLGLNGYQLDLKLSCLFFSTIVY